MLVFIEGGKPEYLKKNPFGARTRTNNKLNPQMTSHLGIEARPHWWEASAFITVQSLLPYTVCASKRYILIHM